jgi:hypothetical protein
VARVYDLVMTHKLDADDFFIHRVQQHCAERGLNFFLIEPLWLEPFRIYCELGEVSARVLLNMHSEHHEPDEAYHRLVRFAHERGTRVIDPPDVALAAFDKARLHPRLVEAGLPVPYSVVVEQEAAKTFQLGDAERVALGNPFVIKPCMGYGRNGVLLDATSEKDLVRSVEAWPNPHYLLQRRMVPRALGADPAYFRVYYVFKAIWCCWWNCYTDRYRVVNAVEMEKFQLARLPELVRRIAELTGMNFFSSEITQTEEGDFVLIDYVNDQCHLVTQSAEPRIGVPDDVVAGIALRLVEGAQELMAQAR